MKFLLFVDSFPSLTEVYGGEKIRPYELGTNLVELGHDVRVVEVRKLGRTRVISGCSVSSIRRLRPKVLREIAMPFQMLGILIKEIIRARIRGESLCLYQRLPMGIKLKLRFLPIADVPTLLLFPIARALRVKVWAGMHDLAPDHQMHLIEQNGKNGIAVSRSFLRECHVEAALQHVAVKWASFTTAVSTAMTEELTRRHGAKPRRVCVFTSGINPSLTSAIDPWIAPRDHEVWRIGYVGNAVDANLELLVAAARIVAQTRAIKIVLAGVGSDKLNTAPIEVERRPQQLYHGFSDLAKRIDIWVVPYLTSYTLNITWPLKTPMYLASGRPLVTTDTKELQRSGLLPFVFPTGTTAVDIARDIEAVITNPELASRKAAAGREFVLTNLTWKKIIARIVVDLELAA